MTKGSIGRKTGKIVKCDNCGREVYKYPRDLKRRQKHFCSYTCMGKGMSHFGPKNPNYKTGGHLYYEAKSSARKRDIEFLLTQKQYETFKDKQCFYCGDTIKGVRLDRVDNDLGYIMENIVPCCKICNYMKMALSYGEFIDHIGKILYNRVLSE